MLLCKRLFVLFLFVFTALGVKSQGTPAEIKKTDEVQIVDGKKFYIHIVEKGQTLFSIARTYGVRYQETTIKSDIDKLSIGDTVWVPVREEIPVVDIYFNYYEVKPGETLYSLTKRYNISETDLKSVNPELDTAVLKAGQIIKIPRLTENIKEAFDAIDSIENEDQFTGLDSIIEEEWTGKIIIKPRKSKQDIYVTLMMPFHLDLIDQISTSKFDIDQRRKKNYKSFEFLQFYEGILMGLEKLEQQGYSVVLNVYDVEQNDSEKVKVLFEKEEVQTSDFIIALLYQSAFNTAANLARKYNTFIINPLSERADIIENNPYVIKYSPSAESYANAVISILKKDYPLANIIFVHSGKPTEKIFLDCFAEKLADNKGITHKSLIWDSKLNFSSHLSNEKKNIIVSLYDQNKQSNTLYVSFLLNKLGSMKKNPPILFGPVEWLDYPNIDYSYLERLKFHYADNLYLDPLNYLHQKFINEFITKYAVEPNSQFAAVGHDLIIHFVTGLQQKKEKFWERPNASSTDILHPTSYKRAKPNSGFENNRRFIYKIENYQPIRAN